MFNDTQTKLALSHIRRSRPRITATAPDGALIYRFEAQLTDVNPVGVLPEGLRFANPFAGTVTDGPLSGSRIWGIDHFLVRPDGVGVIDAPETLSRDGLHVTGHVRGYALPPAESPAPELASMLRPDFVWPDVPFRLACSALFRTADPDLAWLNSVVGIITGEVNMSTGSISVEARAAA